MSPLPDVPPGLSQAADDEVDLLVAQLEAGGIAAAVLVEDGRYFQGRPQPAIIPADGGTQATDDKVKPADRTKSYKDWGISLTANPKIQSAVTEYEGPSGKGYQIDQAVQVAGEIWRRVIHVTGPETWRTSDWEECDA